MTIIGQDRMILWFQPNGPGTAFEPFGVGEKGAGMTGKTLPGPNQSPVFGRTSTGAPVVIKSNTEPPGDLPTATIQIFERGQVDILLKTLQKGCPINIQARIVDCGALNSPVNWDTLDHWADGKVTQYTQGDGPSLEYNGEQITVEAQVSFTHFIRLVKTALSGLTTSEVQNLLDIDGLPEEDCNLCGNGYPGADQILIIGAASSGAAEANAIVSGNGGSSWTATSADPFSAGTFEDASLVQLGFIAPTQIRYIVGTKTVAAGAKAKFSYADVTLGDLTTTTWAVSTIAAGSNGDVIEAMAWLFFDRLYMASAGDIYLSDDQAESDPGTAIYTGATAINGFIKSPDGEDVFAYGASNLILREKNQSGTFETRTGPSGGGAFTAMVISGEGIIYAGNGTSIFKNTDSANNAGNWTSLKDFGANQSVVEIQVIGGERALGGDSELLRVVVDDTAGSDGSVWESVDGGASFVQVTNRTNVGYNAAYFSQIDDNLGIVVGDATGGFGIIHRLSSKV